MPSNKEVPLERITSPTIMELSWGCLSNVLSINLFTFHSFVIFLPNNCTVKNSLPYCVWHFLHYVLSLIVSGHWLRTSLCRSHGSHLSHDEGYYTVRNLSKYLSVNTKTKFEYPEPCFLSTLFCAARWIWCLIWFYCFLLFRFLLAGLENLERWDCWVTGLRL